MSTTLYEVARDAMALDPADRLRLAAELIDSVEGEVDPDWSQAWAEEIARRTEDADAREARGEARGSTWAEARRRLLNGL